MGKGLGKNERKIIEAFEKSNRNKAEIRELIYYIKGHINTLNDYEQILELENKLNISNAVYKSILRSVTSLEKKGYLKKQYLNFTKENNSASTINKRILKINYRKNHNT